MFMSMLCYLILNICYVCSSRQMLIVFYGHQNPYYDIYTKIAAKHIGCLKSVDGGGGFTLVGIPNLVSLRMIVLF